MQKEGGSRTVRHTSRLPFSAVSPRGLPLFKRLVLPRLHNAFVGGADDLVHIDKLFHAVGTPADNAGNREDRGVQFDRDAQHIVDKAGNRRVCAYIRGYCEGVIETLLGGVGVTLTCQACPMKNKFKSECVFNISLSE